MGYHTALLSTLNGRLSPVGKPLRKQYQETENKCIKTDINDLEWEAQK